MRYMKLSLLLILVGSLLACGAIVISPPDQERIARNLGYNAAYWPLRNNRDYISKVDLPLGVALSAIEDENVDIAGLLEKIVDFGDRFFDQPEFKEFAGPAKQALRDFKGIISLDITIPEKRQETIALTKAFLLGAQTAIEDLKALEAKS